MKLTGFLQKLSGEQLIVELKNGTVVLGTVIGTDVAMNMHLRVVTLTAKAKNPVKMDALSIRGSTVRYIMCVLRGVPWGSRKCLWRALGSPPHFHPPHASSLCAPARSLPDSLNLDVLLVDDTQRIKPVKEAAPMRGRGGRGGRGGMRGRGRGM